MASTREFTNTTKHTVEVARYGLIQAGGTIVIPDDDTSALASVEGCGFFKEGGSSKATKKTPKKGDK